MIEEINAIIQANPGFLVNPLANARDVVYLPLLITTVTEKAGKQELKAINVSSKGTIVKNLYLVAQVNYETTTHKREQKAIQRAYGTANEAPGMSTPIVVKF